VVDDLTAEPMTIERLTGDLRRLGVEAGDVVMVHASLRAIGPEVREADGVFDAFAASVGRAGTSFMTVGARDDWAWVNERPEHERPDLLVDAEPFDPLVTPAEPDVGVLAEVFRTRRHTKVSDHPEGRFAASGRLADALVADVPRGDHYGPGSPLERCVKVGARVLRLGADPDTFTLVHYAEYLAQVPPERRVRRHRLVVAAARPEMRTVKGLDDSDGIVAYPGGGYFAVILRGCLATGRARSGVVGRAATELIDAADLIDFAVAWMAAHLVPAGHEAE
jgi:aminoglycoside N3'-acetyltransferase